MTWPIIWPNPTEADALDSGVKIIAEMYASACMDFLTLGRVGGSPITIRPDNVEHHWFDWYQPAGFDVPLFYPSSADLKNATSRGQRLSGIRLPGPVGMVTEVTVGGIAVDASTYQLVNGSVLARIDGSDWPEQDGTLVVTYLNSYPVDGMGKRAAGFLAREFALLFGNPTGKGRSGGTRLPSSVTNVIRQGVTYEVIRGMFPDGLTGLPEIDAYLMLWNPHGLRERPRVYSPDLPVHRQVWP